MRDGQTAACRAAGALAVVLFAWWATADGGYARSWNVHVEVALLDVRDGRRTAALQRLQRARALNPDEALIGAALETVARGEAPDADLLDRLYRRGVPGPIVRRPVDCLPIQGLGAACTREAGG